MNDQLASLGLVSFAAVAVAAVNYEAPTILRVPIVLVFALIIPGLAVTRFLPTIRGVDRIALSIASTLALNILVSLAFVAIGRWSGLSILIVLSVLTAVFAVLPRTSPWHARRDRELQRRNEQILARKKAQNEAYDQVLSPDPKQRRIGLAALSWLLEDDGRRDEAARVRALSKMAVPPRIPVRTPDTVPEGRLRDAHSRARSQDPETRRRGLIEVAAMLDADDLTDEAATLRRLAISEEPPQLS